MERCIPRKIGAPGRMCSRPCFCVNSASFENPGGGHEVSGGGRSESGAMCLVDVAGDASLPGIGGGGLRSYFERCLSRPSTSRRLRLAPRLRERSLL